MIFVATPTMSQAWTQNFDVRVKLYLANNKPYVLGFHWLIAQNGKFNEFLLIAH